MYIKKRIKTQRIVIVPYPLAKGVKDAGLAEIDRDHRNKGRMMCGFHYIIRLDGMIEPARELEQRGNYRRKYNHDSVYVCLVGDEKTFTKEQLASLDEVVEDELLDLWPDAEVINLT